MQNIRSDIEHREPDERASPPSTADLEKLSASASEFHRSGRYADAARAYVRIAAALPDDWLAQYNAGAVSLQADRIEDSLAHLERALALHEAAVVFDLYAHVLALRGDMPAAKAAYLNAARVSPRDFAAHWGLFEVLQLLDDNAGALHHQRLALAERSLVSIAARVAPARLTILELCVAGTFQANIPLDFILDGDRITVHKLYLGVHPVPALPPYDIVFNTIAEGPGAGAALDAATRFVAAEPRPVLNAPELVDLTSRHSVAALFADSPLVEVAATVRATRTQAAADHPAFPFLIRPLDSHAGNDLAKIDDAAALAAYLDATPHVDEFYLAAFIDYRNDDGYYRKYRIVFVDGVPYPVHLAISPRWMIHYYNAPMAENQWMRDEEHAFMRDMECVFGGERAAGLREMARAIPLDYFGIDCSIAADGRVLLFEASAAMIVHMRDPIDLYPYKVKYVPRIITALERLMQDRLSAAGRA